MTAVLRDGFRGSASDRVSRLRLVVRGAVQGVGFRPAVYRLAVSLDLNGQVCNSSSGVVIEVEGREDLLREFQLRLRGEAPLLASIQSLESTYLDPLGYQEFQIKSSIDSGRKTALVMPDIATCPDCLAEILDPSNRRHLYPFTNCTNCGPRFSILESLPYDRRGTTMKGFEMCVACRAEYDDPRNRRFHAQPNACPDCGPRLRLLDRSGSEIPSAAHDPLEVVAGAIRDGLIVAVKGVGGFHLFVDARNELAIGELRRRKRRYEKPFALIYPSLAGLRLDCEVSPMEERLLLSAEAPIVILRRIGGETAGMVANDLIAPGNPTLGVMLPSNPIHHLLLARLGIPVVATSGNISDEPICIDELEALARLGAIADLFLVHNRPIARHVDDSIVRVVAGRELILRRARGYAPLPIELDEPLPSILATGAHHRNSIALSNGSNVFLSQHVGDLDTAEASRAFEDTIGSFEQLYGTRPTLIACDLHPDYLSTHYAARRPEPRHGVQHHLAHVLSCMAENGISPPILGVAWDGTGFGHDGTIWGGEFLRVKGDDSYERIAHWRTFPLPGGESAVREPRRAAIGLLHEIFGCRLFRMGSLAPLAGFTENETEILGAMLDRRFNSPRTSSAGRLFDAMASLIGIRQQSAFEGQAAMEMEFALSGTFTDDRYPVEVTMCAEESEEESGRKRRRTMVLDWEPMVHQIIADIENGVPRGVISARFHNTLVESLATVAGLSGEPRVCLSGGCFQNRYLTERSILRLREEGLSVYWHQRVPPNDGGIALGQILAAARQFKMG